MCVFFFRLLISFLHVTSSFFGLDIPHLLYVSIFKLNFSFYFFFHFIFIYFLILLDLKYNKVDCTNNIVFIKIVAKNLRNNAKLFKNRGKNINNSYSNAHIHNVHRQIRIYIEFSYKTTLFCFVCQEYLDFISLLVSIRFSISHFVFLCFSLEDYRIFLYNTFLKCFSAFVISLSLCNFGFLHCEMHVQHKFLLCIRK